MRLRDLPEIERLTIPEKMLLIEDLWNSIATDPSEVPVPDSHIQELEHRQHRHSTEPGPLLSLEELQRAIEARK